MGQPTEIPATTVICHESLQCIGSVVLDWEPQPGHHLILEDQHYIILERRHQYCYCHGRYCLSSVKLYVQLTQPPIERTWLGHYWGIGDATCTYNAQHELMRCAVNPLGPCCGCNSYLPRHELPHNP